MQKKITESSQRFGFRKSKAVKGLGVALLGTFTLVTAGVTGAGTVLADEVVPSTTSTTDIPVSSDTVTGTGVGVATETPVSTDTANTSSPVTEGTMGTSTLEVAPSSMGEEEVAPVTMTVDNAQAQQAVATTRAVPTVSSTEAVASTGVPSDAVAAQVADAPTPHFGDAEPTFNITPSPTTVNSTGQANYDMVVTKTTNTDGIIVPTQRLETANTGETFFANSMVTVSTTSPATLSANSFIRQTITPDKDYDLDVLPAVTEYPVGVVSEGTVLGVPVTFTGSGMPHGSVINVLYELVDNGVVLRTATDKYTIDKPDLRFKVVKGSGTEYLVEYESGTETVKTSKPLTLVFSPVDGTSADAVTTANTLQRVEYTVPTGFTLTAESKAEGWVQTGNTVTRTFVYSNLVSDMSAPFLTENNVTGVLTSKPSVSFDITGYGTRTEFETGKSYSIPVKVKTLDENGYAPEWTTTVTGRIRALDDSVGQGNVAIDTNVFPNMTDDVDSVQVNILAPFELDHSDIVRMVKEEFLQGKTVGIPEVIINFDTNNYIKEFKVGLGSLSATTLDATGREKVFTFGSVNVYDTKTGTLLGSITGDGKSNLQLPDNTQSITLRPTDGSAFNFGMDNLYSLKVNSFISPTNKDILKQQADALQSDLQTQHRLTVKDIFVEDKIIFNNVGYSVRVNTEKVKTIPQDKPASAVVTTPLISEGGRNSTKYSDVVDSAELVMVVPKGFTVTHVIPGVGTNTYTEGTHVIPHSSFTKDTSDIFSYTVKADDSVADGIYDLMFYVDWSKSSKTIQDITTGLNPLPSVTESTYNVQQLIVRKEFKLATQTQVADKNGVYSEDKKDVVSGTEFTLKSNVINTLGASVTGANAMQYIPREGILGSTYNVSLTKPIEAPTGWKVLYTTGTTTGNYDTDSANLTFTETVADYSKVTAVKYVAEGELVDNSYIPFILTVKTDDKLTVDDVAFSQTGLRADQYPTYVVSNLVRMTPSVYTEDWRSLVDNSTLAPQEVGTEVPPTTPNETFPSYRYVRSEVDEVGNVIHYYDKSIGDVVVQYVSTSGTTIKKSVTLLDDAPVGDSYDTTTQKPQTIDYEGYTYTFRDVKFGSEKGKVVEGTTTIIYQYDVTPKSATTENKGTVVVNYVLQSDKSKLKDSVTPVSDVVVSTTTTTTTPSGTTNNVTPTNHTYDTTALGEDLLTVNGVKYKKVGVQGKESGVTPVGTAEVTYLYAPVTTVQTTEDIHGTITVNFKEDGTNTEIAPPQVLHNDVVVARNVTAREVYTDANGKEVELSSNTVREVVDVPYDTIAVRKDTVDYNSFTYSLVAGKVDKSTADLAEVGNLQEGNHAITYYYTANPKSETVDLDKGNTVVRYFAKDSKGNTYEISEPVTGAEEVVTTRTTTTLPTGSTFVDNATGATYDVNDSSKSSIDYNGFTYNFVETKGNMTGSLVKGTTYIDHYYEVVPKVTETTNYGSVSVEYRDAKTGQVIKDGDTASENVPTSKTVTTVTPEGTTEKRTPLNTTYNAEPLKVSTIEAKNGFNYNFTSVKDGVPTNGLVPDGSSLLITYLYTATPNTSVTSSEGGTVIVEYRDVATGVEVKSSEKLVDNALVSETRTTVDSDGTSVDEKVPTNVTYSTVDSKVEEVEYNGFTYKLVPTRVEGTESGLLPAGTTKVIYYYEVVPKVEKVPVYGSVTVKYTDTKGTLISEDTVLHKEVLTGHKVVTTTPSGTSEVFEPVEQYEVYSTKSSIKEDITGYTYTGKSEGNTEEGNIDGDIVVTYIYDVTPKPIIEPTKPVEHTNPTPTDEGTPTEEPKQNGTDEAPTETPEDTPSVEDKSPSVSTPVAPPVPMPVVGSSANPVVTTTTTSSNTQLPNTGSQETSSSYLSMLGLTALGTGLFLASRKRKEEE